MSKPQQLDNIDLKPLQDLCQSYIDFVASGQYHEDNDFKSYIFETAIIAYFGPDVFETFINKR